MSILTFSENFNAANQNLNGYNGWSVLSSTAAIVSNRCRQDANGYASHALDNVPNLPITATFNFTSPGTLRMINYLSVGGTGIGGSAFAAFAVYVQDGSGGSRSFKMYDSFGTTVATATTPAAAFAIGDVVTTSWTINLDGSGVASCTNGTITHTCTWGARTWTSIINANVHIANENANNDESFDDIVVTYGSSGGGATYIPKIMMS